MHIRCTVYQCFWYAGLIESATLTGLKHHKGMEEIMILNCGVQCMHISLV